MRENEKERDRLGNHGCETRGYARRFSGGDSRTPPSWSPGVVWKLFSSDSESSTWDTNSMFTSEVTEVCWNGRYSTNLYWVTCLHKDAILSNTIYTSHLLVLRWMCLTRKSGMLFNLSWILPIILIFGFLLVLALVKTLATSKLSTWNSTLLNLQTCTIRMPSSKPQSFILSLSTL